MEGENLKGEDKDECGRGGCGQVEGCTWLDAEALTNR